jgi:hypothetical protein
MPESGMRLGAASGLETLGGSAEKYAPYSALTSTGILPSAGAKIVRGE